MLNDRKNHVFLPLFHFTQTYILAKSKKTKKMKSSISQNTEGEDKGQKEIPTEEKNGVQISKADRLNKPKMYVGIGASAGGLEALELFFKNMPNNTDVAFIVVQHLSPDYKSMMVELLHRHTKMEVIRVEDGMDVDPNKIYLIPPKNNMTIFHGQLYLTKQDHNRALNLPIDIFLRSLAADQEKKAVGIILSGTGSDGSLGIRAIKETGGMVMVQDPQSSKFDGMPKSAIATGIVDYILTADKLPQALIDYIKHPFNLDKRNNLEDENMGRDAITKILSIIRTRIGVDFTFYKPNTIIRRLERRLSINQISDIENYIQLLHKSNKEIGILYKELLIGVTQFFRDQEAFEKIFKDVIPKIADKKDAADKIRIWSMGCSTGEEAYSIAIMFKEYLETKNLNIDVKIFATDLDSESIEYAGVGYYPESIAADISPSRLKNYFKKKEGGYQITNEIRKMVVFAAHNILRDPPFSKIDLVICRNVLIYLKAEMQKKILSMFQFSLVTGGYLFLGSSESIGEKSDFFTTINSKWKIFEKKEGFAPPLLNDLFLPLNKKQPLTVRRTKESYTYRGIPKAISENIFEQLLMDYVPPGVLLDDNFEIVHFFKEVDEFIKFPSGKASWNILKLARKELAIVLGSILHKAKKEKKEVEYKSVPKSKIESGDKTTFDISVRFFEDEKSKQAFYLLTFSENQKDTLEAKSKRKSEKIKVTTDQSERISELEKELQDREENLQTTIEELETSNEELQATNEELVASNEELQSTNEELQSVNEELYTVNSEHQNKIQELTALNADMNNLLNNTNIGTLFLDSKLRIRKFTKHITKVINIMEIDIGRSISDITFNTEYTDLLSDIEDVMEDLNEKEIEIKGKNNEWHLLRINPYRTAENAINGVIVTIIDITELKASQENLSQEKDLLYRVLSSSPIGKIIINNNRQVTFANNKAKNLFHIDNINNDLNIDALNFSFRSKEDKKLPKSQNPFEVLLKTQKYFKEKSYLIKFNNQKDLSCISVSGEPFFNNNNEIGGGIFSIEEIKCNE